MASSLVRALTGGQNGTIVKALRKSVARKAPATNGNVAKTFTVGVDAETQIFNTPLTVDRAVTLATVGAVAGSQFRIVRTAAATGAFNLNVGTGPLKALAVGTWADFEYNGTAWVLTASGSL